MSDADSAGQPKIVIADQVFMQAIDNDVRAFIARIPAERLSYWKTIYVGAAEGGRMDILLSFVRGWHYTAIPMTLDFLREVDPRAALAVEERARFEWEATDRAIRGEPAPTRR